jgi:hypothetical protein
MRTGGGFLELLLIIANIGTAVVLYPILKRQNESLALGYVTARLVECTFIAVGILSVLAVVTLRQDAAGAGADSLAVSLAAIKDWTFLLGPGFVVGVGNGLLLGYLMYRSGLVPRRMAMLGLVGGPLICASGIAVMFDLFDAGSAPPGHRDNPGVRVGVVAWHLRDSSRLRSSRGKRDPSSRRPDRSVEDEAEVPFLGSSRVASSTPLVSAADLSTLLVKDKDVPDWETGGDSSSDPGERLLVGVTQLALADANHERDHSPQQGIGQQSGPRACSRGYSPGAAAFPEPFQPALHHRYGEGRDKRRGAVSSASSRWAELGGAQTSRRCRPSR